MLDEFLTVSEIYCFDDVGGFGYIFFLFGGGFVFGFLVWPLGVWVGFQFRL